MNNGSGKNENAMNWKSKGFFRCGAEHWEEKSRQIINKLIDFARPVSILIIICGFLLLIVNLFTHHNNTTIFGPTLGADYPAFYFAGKILNSEPDRLYDLSLQNELYHELAPQAPADWFPLYPNAPFFAVPFRILALLPYQWSYVAWLGIGVLLFGLGIYLLRHSELNFSKSGWITVTLLSASFMPFLFEGWLGGQTSPFVLFCLAAIIYLLSHKQQIASGSVLAILLFKPTLLLLLLPMFFFTKQFRVIIGFAAGGLALLIASVWAVGVHGCMNYVRFLMIYMEIKKNNPEALIPWKYVDIRSALYPVFYHPNTFTLVILTLLVGIAGLLILLAWLRDGFIESDKVIEPIPTINRECSTVELNRINKQQSLALALVWTPVLSPHCAIYDVSLLIPAAIIMAATTKESSPIFVGLLALTYITALFSQPVSASIGFQPISLTIALLGCYQLSKIFLGSGSLAGRLPLTPILRH